MKNVIQSNRSKQEQEVIFSRKKNTVSHRSKQEQEVIFSRKKNTVSHSPLFSNNSEVKLSPNQKHLVLAVYSKLLFSELINNKQRQSNKVVGLF